jgi:hypothetical protein
MRSLKSRGSTRPPPDMVQVIAALVCIRRAVLNCSYQRAAWPPRRKVIGVHGRYLEARVLPCSWACRQHGENPFMTGWKGLAAESHQPSDFGHDVLDR